MANILRITTKTNERITTVAFDRDAVAMDFRVSTNTRGYINTVINVNSAEKNIAYVSIADASDVITNIISHVEDLSCTRYMEEMNNDHLFDIMMMAKHIVIDSRDNLQFIEIF